MISAMLDLFEEMIDSVKGAMRRRYAFDRLQIVVYPGFSNDETAFIRGRVLLGKNIESSQEDHGKMRNFRNMAKRFFSSEIRHAHLQVEWQGNTREIYADHEGFFFEQLPIEGELEPNDIQVRVLEPNTREPVVETAPVCVEGQQRSDLIVVSDVDDTILLTMARRMFRMVALTLFGNAHQRQTFVGTASWYQALRRGADGLQENPFFYVSSSPWNIYDFLQEFLTVNRIPEGPFILRDHGLGARGTHRLHKVNAVQQLLAIYPDQPFLLIGDSGQHDPEIYRELVEKNPGRFKGVFIRNVTGLVPVRNSEVERIGRAIEEAGCPFRFFERSEEALETSWRWRLIYTGGASSVSRKLPESAVTADKDRTV